MNPTIEPYGNGSMLLTNHDSRKMGLDRSDLVTILRYLKQYRLSLINEVIYEDCPENYPENR